MQAELQDDGSVARKVPLECSDTFEAMLPDVLADKSFWNALRFQELRPNAHRQNLLVVRPVMNSNVSTLRQSQHRSPEKIVSEFLRIGRLEGMNHAALGIEAGHHVL